MNDVKIFENPEFGRVRTVSVDNEPWFFAKDVCDALSVATNHVRESLDEDEVSNLRTTEIGPEFGGKAPLIVSEAGLYSLILKSRKPEAKAFKRWITHEVIPAIRKTGGYQVPQSPAEQMARGILAAQKLLAERDATIAKQDILIGDLAKLIKQNGHDIGQKRLFAWLREKGYLVKRKGLDWNMPTQRAMEMKLFRVKETVVTHSDGHTTVSKTPKVTGKGQVYFVNKFLAASKALN